MSEPESDDEPLVDYESMCANDGIHGADVGASETPEEGEIAMDGEDAGETRARAGRGTSAEATMIDARDPGRIDLAEKDLIVAERVRRAIEEPKGHLLRVLAKRFGGDALERCLRETTRVVREGGVEYEEGCAGSGVWRKRTRAGCFLMVFKRSHDAAAVEAALAESRDIDRALKRLRRERASGRGRGRGRG